MRHPPAGVERRHRFGPHPLALPRPHLAHRHLAIHLRNHRPHHVAALVGLGDDAVRFELVERRHRPPCPGIGMRRSETQVRQHHRLIPTPRRHHDAAAIGTLVPGHRRIDRHHSALATSALVAPKHAPAPQRIGQILDQLPLELLPPQHGMLVSPHHLAQKPRRKVLPVHLGRHSRGLGARLGQQPFQQLGRPRRRGHQLSRPIAEP
jgi:hypothetical protein